MQLYFVDITGRPEDIKKTMMASKQYIRYNGITWK
jgi:hypothetical protein